MSTSSPNAVTQPVARPVTVTANQLTGYATFTWESIPVSQTWVGTLSCPAAPYFAAMTVFNFADQIGFFRASNAFGPLYLPAGGQLSVTATGLLPGTQYTMFFIGYVSTETEVPPVFPNAYADTVIATNQGGLQQVTLIGAPVSAPFPPPPVGFAYRIHSITTFSAGAANTAILYTGGTGFTIFAATWAATSFQTGSTFLMNGLLVADSIVAESVQSGLSVDCYILYDLVAI